MISRLLILLPLLLSLLVGAEKVVSDDSIYDWVRRRLASDPVVKGGALEVDVKQGIVTLRGVVELPKQKERAEKVAKKVDGVKQVVNELKVARPK